jgi:ferredoxin
LTVQAVSEPPDDLEVLVEAASACPNFAITVQVDGKVVSDSEGQ